MVVVIKVVVVMMVLKVGSSSYDGGCGDCSSG